MAGSPNASNMVVGLDIGTSKVVAIVGQPTDDGGIEIAGIGSHPSRGMKRGVVINIESTVQSIQRAVEEADVPCRWAGAEAQFHPSVADRRDLRDKHF